MVQAPHLGEGDDLTSVRPLDRSRLWGIFVQSQVRPTSVVVREIVLEQTVQVSPVEHDHVVQAFSADTTNQAFDVRYCQGERGAIRISSRPKASARRWNWRP
jgi:hypothetical protein